MQIFLEGILAGGIIIICYSQIIRPLLKGTPAFPFCRSRPNIEGEIEKIDESLEDKELRKQLEKKQKQLDK